jgi:hypothetical protein
LLNITGGHPLLKLGDGLLTFGVTIGETYPRGNYLSTKNIKK